MGRPSHLFGILIAAGVAAALSPVFPSQAPEPGSAERERPPVRPETRMVPQRQWEYMQLPCVPMGEATGQRKEQEDRLNEQGKRGWEMVSLIEVQHPPVRGCLLATFKRQVLN
jgi:hypothetical protein